MEPLFIGQIAIFAGNFAVRKWTLCNGSALEIAFNRTLFAIIGYTYTPKVDRDKGIFNLPDLQGRTTVGVGQGPGLDDFPLGLTGGAETIILKDLNMPAHKHTISGTLNFNNAPGDESYPFNASLALSPVQIYSADGPTEGFSLADGTITATASSTGSSTPFNNRDPFLALNFMIATHF